MVSQDLAPNQETPLNVEDELAIAFAPLRRTPLPMRPEYVARLRGIILEELAAQASRRAKRSWWRRSAPSAQSAPRPGREVSPSHTGYGLRLAMVALGAVLILTLGAVLVSRLASLDPRSQVATLSVIDGELHIARPVSLFIDTGLMRSITVSPGQLVRLRPGDQLSSDSATEAEIALSDGSKMAVGSGAQLTVEELQARSASKPLVVAMRLERGEVRSQVERLRPENGERFEVSTPSLVAHVKGTVFRVGVESDKTRVATDKGLVRVSFDGKAFDIEAGRELMVRLGESVPEVNVRPQPPRMSSTALAERDGGGENASERYFVNTTSMPWVIQTLPGARVAFYVNDVVLKEMIANDDGVAAVDFTPDSEGIYRITASMETATGEASLAAPVKTVVVDYTHPPLLLTSPSDPQVTTSSVSLAGSTEPGVTLFANGEPVIVDEQGDFSQELPLALGANPINLVATDPAGNSITLESVIVYEPAQ